jgi:hypothetical protein
MKSSLVHTYYPDRKRHSAFKLFCRLFEFDLRSLFRVPDLDPNAELDRFIETGGAIKFYRSGQVVDLKGAGNQCTTTIAS